MPKNVKIKRKLKGKGVVKNKIHLDINGRDVYIMSASAELTDEQILEKAERVKGYG